jgi:hypothetical protein
MLAKKTYKTTTDNMGTQNTGKRNNTNRAITTQSRRDNETQVNIHYTQIVSE